MDVVLEAIHALECSYLLRLDSWISGITIKVCDEPLCKNWESNPGPLKEQYVLLAVKLSLNPLTLFVFIL